MPETTNPDRGVTVITIPPPTANGPLHVGHLSGPYLASDIAGRAAKARGEDVLVVAGIDTGQNFIPTMAEVQGLDVDGMMARYRAEILEAFRLGRIQYDTFIDPDEPAYRTVLADLVGAMVERGALPMGEMTLPNEVVQLRTQSIVVFYSPPPIRSCCYLRTDPIQCRPDQSRTG